MTRLASFMLILSVWGPIAIARNVSAGDVDREVISTPLVLTSLRETPGPGNSEARTIAPGRLRRSRTVSFCRCETDSALAGLEILSLGTLFFIVLQRLHAAHSIPR